MNAMWSIDPSTLNALTFHKANFVECNPKDLIGSLYSPVTPHYHCITKIYISLTAGEVCFLLNHLSAEKKR